MSCAFATLTRWIVQGRSSSAKLLRAWRVPRRARGSTELALPRYTTAQGAQLAWMLSRLNVPGHGSPKVVLLAVTLHEPRFRHALSTTPLDVLALQLEVANDPQLPVGVP